MNKIIQVKVNAVHVTHKTNNVYRVICLYMTCPCSHLNNFSVQLVQIKQRDNYHGKDFEFIYTD